MTMCDADCVITSVQVNDVYVHRARYLSLVFWIYKPFNYSNIVKINLYIYKIWKCKSVIRVSFSDFFLKKKIWSIGNVIWYLRYLIITTDLVTGMLFKLLKLVKIVEIIENLWNNKIVCYINKNKSKIQIWHLSL